jgi:hypothetical protein
MKLPQNIFAGKIFKESLSINQVLSYLPYSVAKPLDFFPMLDQGIDLKYFLSETVLSTINFSVQAFSF